MKDPITTANKSLIQKLYKEVLVHWNMALVDELVSPRFISHDWPEGTPIGPQPFKDFYSEIRSALPDARYKMDDLIAEDEKVAVRWRLVGTHEGYYRGIAPTGKQLVLKGVAIYRLEDGKVMERWVVTDFHKLLKDIQPALSVQE